MRRSGQPSLPSAMTCCFFDSFKTLLMPTQPTRLHRDSMSGTSLPLAGFQVIIIGRFWVITEELQPAVRQLALKYAVGQTKTSLTGDAELSGIAAGTYYLTNLVETEIGKSAVLWEVAVGIRPGETTQIPR